MIRPDVIARLYVTCVETEDRLRSISEEAAEEMQELRAELHALLMESFREAGIPFIDRADAAHKAFYLARQPSTSPR